MESTLSADDFPPGRGTRSAGGPGLLLDWCRSLNSSVRPQGRSSSSTTFAPPSCQPAPGTAVPPSLFGDLGPAQLGPEPVEWLVGGGPGLLRPPRRIVGGFLAGSSFALSSAGLFPFGPVPGQPGGHRRPSCSPPGEGRLPEPDRPEPVNPTQDPDRVHRGRRRSNRHSDRSFMTKDWKSRSVWFASPTKSTHSRINRSSFSMWTWSASASNIGVLTSLISAFCRS